MFNSYSFKNMIEYVLIVFVCHLDVWIVIYIFQPAKKTGQFSKKSLLMMARKQKQPRLLFDYLLKFNLPIFIWLYLAFSPTSFRLTQRRRHGGGLGACLVSSLQGRSSNSSKFQEKKFNTTALLSCLLLYPENM